MCSSNFENPGKNELVSRVLFPFLKIGITRAILGSYLGRLILLKSTENMFQNNKYFFGHFFDNISRYIIIS